MTRKLAMMFALMPLVTMAATWYVNGSSGADWNSGTSQSSAKATIQAAINAASAGDTILVSPGTYGSITSPNKAVTIKSTGNALNTFIDGGRARPCAILNAHDGSKPSDTVIGGFSLILNTHDYSEQSNTVIDGFTLRNGYGNGAGNPGGAVAGTLLNCIVRNNEGGGYAGGSGCVGSTVKNCLVCDNKFRAGSADEYVGGQLYAYFGGGALANCKVENCTVVNNEGYGFWDGEISNSIAYGNTCDAYFSPKANFSKAMNYSRIGTMQIGTTTSPSMFGTGNSWGDPLLTYDHKLSSSSPCIDAGDNSYVTGDKDLAGNARIANGRVDIGCYEYGAVVPPTPATHTVTFDMNGADGAAPAGRSVAHGAVIGVLPDDVTRTGFSFEGWYTAANGGTKISASTRVVANATYYAHWSADVSFPDVTTWKFYEEADDDEGLNLAAWEEWDEKDVAFWMGAGINMAIPVNENLSASDIVLVAGTYSGYGRPQVVSDEWMFAKHCTALERAVGYDPYKDDEYDQGAYGLVFEDDVKGRNYSLSMDIWPQKKVLSGRKWILLEMGGNPTKGCKTFYLGVKGRDDVGYSRFRIYATPDQGVSQSPSSWSGQRELAVLPMPIGSGTTSGSGMYASGTRVSLSATPNAGYEFEGWYDQSNGQRISASANLSFATTGENKTVFAKFRQKAAPAQTYILRLHRNNSERDGATAGRTYTIGKARALPKAQKELKWAPRKGYDFLGWARTANATTAQYTDGQSLKDLTKTAGATVHLYAVWKAHHYIVRLHRNNSKNDGATTGRAFDYDQVRFLPTMAEIKWARSGYMFLGWSLAQSSTTVKYADGLNVFNLSANDGEELHLWGVWKKSEANAYLLRLHRNNSERDGATAGRQLKLNTNRKLPTVKELGWTRSDATFKGWATTAKNAAAGKVAYKDGATVKNLVKTLGDTAHLYAVWQ